LRPSSSRWLRIAAKFGVAAALLVWLSRRGDLNLSRLAGAVAHWPYLLAILVVFYFEMVVTAWRWNLLLGAQGIVVSFQKAFSLTMIGSLFNMVIPGAVGGDVVKGYYITRRIEGKRPEAVATILMDRVLGLLGLLLLAAVAAMWNIKAARGSRALELLWLFAISSAAAGLLTLVLAVATGGSLPFLERWRSNLWVAHLLKAAETLGAYRRNPRVLVVALSASVFNQVLSCLAFWLAVQTIDGAAISRGYFFLLVPLGLMTTVLPVSPAGVGVGQAAFFTLFQVLPSRNGALAANAFTVFQVLLILVYLSGFYFYLTYERPVRSEIPASLVSS
jgi:uncharacterized protein (TIRG00374 family)